MSEMIERVARAMEPHTFRTLDRGWAYGPGHIPEHNVIALRNAAKKAEATRRRARTAIEAMRESLNYLHVQLTTNPDRDRGFKEGQASVLYTIDAALK